MHAQVPVSDNYFAALNSAVFSDGSFVYIPKGVKCPMEISTYFRINASETGQVRVAAMFSLGALGLGNLLIAWLIEWSVLPQVAAVCTLD